MSYIKRVINEKEEVSECYTDDSEFVYQSIGSLSTEEMLQKIDEIQLIINNMIVRLTLKLDNEAYVRKFHCLMDAHCILLKEIVKMTDDDEDEQEMNDSYRD